MMSQLMLYNIGHASNAGNDTNNNANTNSSMEDDDSYQLPTIYRYFQEIIFLFKYILSDLRLGGKEANLPYFFLENPFLEFIYLLYFNCNYLLEKNRIRIFGEKEYFLEISLF